MKNKEKSRRKRGLICVCLWKETNKIDRPKIDRPKGDPLISLKPETKRKKLDGHQLIDSSDNKVRRDKCKRQYPGFTSIEITFGFSPDDKKY